MARRIALAFPLLLAGTSCSNTSRPTPVAADVVDSAGIEIVTISGSDESLSMWSISADPTIEIRGDAPPYLGAVGQVALTSDGRLLVVDNLTKELRVFDQDGHYELIGGPGSGPGEFQSITSLTVGQNDTVYVYDRNLHRFTVLDPTGGLIGSLTVPSEHGGARTEPMNGWAFDGAHLVLERRGPYVGGRAEPLPRRDQRDALLFLLDRGGRVRDPPIRFTGDYTAEMPGGRAAVPFSNRPLVAVGADRLAYSSGLAYEITEVDRDFVTSRVIRWEGWPRRPLGEDLERLRETADENLAHIRSRWPDIADQMLDAIFSPAVLPDSLPALGSLLVSTSGELWASSFIPVLRAWNGPSTWHVLGPDGVPLARLLLPTALRIAAVRDSTIAIVVRDSLDVESIRVHVLRRR